MKRSVQYSCFFTDREVNEILIRWLSEKGFPKPSYVANADNTVWSKLSDGIGVEWSEDCSEVVG